MKRHLPILLILACAGAFILGIVQLFKLRFEVGDVYPPYSSLRSDPLGAMAFYESLEKLRGISVRRDHSSANILPEGRDTTYLHLAARTTGWNWLPEELWKEIDAFTLNGGRLAITFYPETAKPFRPLARQTQPGNPPQQKQGGKKKKLRPQEDRAFERDSLKERWGVDLDYLKLGVGDAGSYEPAEVENRSELPLPESLAWHSATIFTNLDKTWRTIYARGTNPVVVERRFGRGSVVMATDSYFLSNEAMLKDRHADLLAWFVGPNRHVIFDEAHHGIMDTSGVATLIRNYRLHGLAAALLVLAALFIWKNSFSLVPPHADEKSAGFVAGRDAASGFVNLLRRNIPARDLLSVCFAEWTKSLYQGRYYTITAVSEAQAVMEEELKRPERQRDPVKTYQKICRTLRTSQSRTPFPKKKAETEATTINHE
jgi:hypothetical protein